MRSAFIAIALAVVGATASAVRAPSPSAAPACVSKCWANSQYVSNCAGSHKCLCDDADFQNAMYQCLYSQCQTAQFGTALHHALGLCQEEESEASSSVPAILRQGDLRKRQGYLTQSVSASVYPTRTISRASQSVSASNYATYSSSRAISTSVASSTSSAKSSSITASSSKTSSATTSSKTASYTGAYLGAKRAEWDGQRYPPSW